MKAVKVAVMAIIDAQWPASNKEGGVEMVEMAVAEMVMVMAEMVMVMAVMVTAEMEMEMEMW